MICLHDAVARIHSVDTATGIAQVTCAECGARGTRSADLVYTWEPSHATRPATTHTFTLSNGMTIAFKDIRSIGPSSSQVNGRGFGLGLADRPHTLAILVQIPRPEHQHDDAAHHAAAMAAVEAERRRLVTAWEVFLGVQPGCRTYEDA